MTTSSLSRDTEIQSVAPDHEPERLPTRAGQKPIMVAITVVPFAGVITAIWLLWGSAVGVTDLVLFGSLYVLCALGITVGYHRMLTHRAFRAHPALRAVLLVFGSMAVQGNAIGWATDHRTHHAHSDKDGDPHSPHAGFASGILGQVRGLVHAHVGWMFHHERSPTETAGPRICSMIRSSCSSTGRSWSGPWRDLRSRLRSAACSADGGERSRD